MFFFALPEPSFGIIEQSLNQAPVMTLLQFLFIGFLIAGFLLSLFGWGTAIRRATYKENLPFSVTASLGLAVLILIGGSVNALCLANGFVLDAIFFTGLFLAFIYYYKAGIPRFYLSTIFSLNILVPVIFLMLAVLHIVLLASSEAFNYHDDTEKYLAHPIRMLATGTLAGSDFNALGTETLGAQAFLHGFLLNHWSVQFINSVDSVFAPILCLLMLAQCAARYKLPAISTILLMVLFTSIVPQFVNISSLYTGSVLIILLLVLPTLFGYSFSAGFCICVALIYSALIALKTNFLLVPVFHWFGLFLMYFYIKSFQFKFLVYIALLSLLFLIPWISLHIDASDLVSLLTETRGSISSSLVFLSFSELLSPQKLFYGFNSSILAYTILIMLPFILSLHTRAYAMLITSFLLLSYLLVMVVLSSTFLGVSHGLRYLAPIIIAVTPVSYLVLLNEKKERGFLPKHLLIVIAILVSITFFLSPAFTRFQHAYIYKNALSFPLVSSDKVFLTYNRRVLGEDHTKYIQKIQGRANKGATLLTWTLSSFKLDYHRNIIIDVDPAGLTSPWLQFPFDEDFSYQKAYILDQNIDYLLWQVHGYAARTLPSMKTKAGLKENRERYIGKNAVKFIRFLQQLSLQSRVVYQDENFLLMKL